MQTAAVLGGHGSSSAVPTLTVTTESRPAQHGKSPPVDPFTGKDVETTLDDWLPSLKRAALWNGWAEEDKLMQLAGHLQEWDLLLEDEKRSYT